MKSAGKAPATFRRAEELLDTRPLPLNVIDQLDELRLKTLMTRAHTSEFYSFNFER